MSFFFVQKFDGFLAILNITGGKFSPHPQKLPFAATSVDGDNYLLYYSSINLAGHLPSNKCKGPKLRRSLSVSGSCEQKARLRIPMKGRIQLVISLFLRVSSVYPSLFTGTCFYNYFSIIFKMVQLQYTCWWWSPYLPKWS